MCGQLLSTWSVDVDARPRIYIVESARQVHVAKPTGDNNARIMLDRYTQDLRRSLNLACLADRF